MNCGLVALALLLRLSTGDVAFIQEPSLVARALKSMATESRSAQQRGLETLARLVESDQAVRSRSDVQHGLARMLQEESERLTAAGARGEAEDDPYLRSYFEELLPAAIAALPDSVGEAETALLVALLGAHFNTDTRPARSIAAAGQPAAVLVVELASSNSSGKRGRAYDLLSQMLVLQQEHSVRQPLSPELEAAARSALLRGLQDRSIVCRREAVRGVERAGLRDAVPVLKELAATDPDDGRSGNGPVRFSVRGLAAKAIATLSKEP